MDPRRERIEQDLRGLISGEVRCDDLSLQLYASDASIYQIKPLCVVRPRTTADVVAVVGYAAEHQIPLHGRGAGSGLAGESLGNGLVLDFARHFRRIETIDEDTIWVQPGAVLERLNAYLLPRERHFGPDPAMAAVTTMGSVVAIDGGGSHWLRYGSARDHVVGMKIVLADGTQMSVGREPLSRGLARDDDQRKRDLINQLAELLGRNQELIRRHQPKSLVNRCGYQLADVYSEEQLDLAKLLAGSEGTLALFTELTLKTQRLPKHHGIAVLMFEGLEPASRAVHEILGTGPSACDMMDRRHLSLARENDARYQQWIAPNAEAVLLVEHDGDELSQVRDRLRQVVDRVQRKKRLAFDGRITVDPREVELLWRLGRRVVPTLYRLKGSTRPLPFVEDIAVPPEALSSFLLKAQNSFKRHEVTASVFAHAGHGQLHMRPFLDLADPQHVRTLDALANELYEAALEEGGTISGEHADGLSRSAFVEKQYGPLFDVFREVKRIFDPHNILNPGKIVGAAPESVARSLRPVALADAAAQAGEGDAQAAGTTPPVFELQLNWDEAEVVRTARSCNGCGACRSSEPDVRMCPIFRARPTEEASPRAKANLMRGIFTGQISAESIHGDDFKRIADLCVNCQMCRLECPAGVDIPRLMVEAKGQYVATNGLRVGDWLLAELDLVGKYGSMLGTVANWVITNPQARWILEKSAGIAQRRKLPRFATRTFLRTAARRRLTVPTRRTGRKVMYFVDTYANYFDPQLANALVAVFEHNGIAVFVPPDQVQSGMSMISVGAIDRARRVATKNLPLLAEAVRQGYDIVTAEPSAALCLKHEYPALVADDDARIVAEHTSEACAYLWERHAKGKLQLDLRPVNASLSYHMPCHVKALGAESAGEALLRLIPGLTVHRTEKGCSGMAGTYGLKRKNFRASLRSGFELISAIRDSADQAGTTECSACKIQMEQGTRKPTIHPLKLLALAYGLMPEVGSLLTAHSKELSVT